MGLLDIFKGKKVSELSRLELEKVAKENNVVFTKETTNKELQDLVSKAITTAGAESKKTIKIKFLLSPTGKFNLAYNVGEECEIDADKGQELIDAEYAEAVK